MTYDLADIARKLRLSPETIAHRTLAEAFLQAVAEIDRLTQREHEAAGIVACTAQMQVAENERWHRHIRAQENGYREKLAAWMIANSLPTGHGDTFDDLLAEATGGLNRLIYVPGLWRCAKCDFRLVQANLNALDGTVTARDTPGDKCPNCDGPLWRVTERQAGNELVDRMDPTQEEITALRARLADAEERLRGFAGVNT